MPELQRRCVVFVGLAVLTMLCPLLNFCLNAFFINPEEEETETMIRIQRDSRGKGIVSFILYGTLFPTMLAWVAIRAEVYIRSPYDLPMLIACIISIILTIIAVIVKLHFRKRHLPSKSAFSRFVTISYLVPIVSGAILIYLHHKGGY